MRKKRNSVLVLLILGVAVIIPSASLSLATMGVYKHPKVFFWNGQPVGPILTFAFLFCALEIVFNTLWCPFRRWTVPICRKVHCNLSKICKDCNVRIYLQQNSPISDQQRSEGRYYLSICENCEIIWAGAISVMSFIGLILWEVYVLSLR